MTSNLSQYSNIYSLQRCFTNRTVAPECHECNFCTAATDFFHLHFALAVLPAVLRLLSHQGLGRDQEEDQWPEDLQEMVDDLQPPRRNGIAVLFGNHQKSRSDQKQTGSWVSGLNHDSRIYHITKGDVWNRMAKLWEQQKLELLNAGILPSLRSMSCQFRSSNTPRCFSRWHGRRSFAGRVAVGWNHRQPWLGSSELTVPLTKTKQNICCLIHCLTGCVVLENISVIHKYNN